MNEIFNPSNSIPEEKSKQFKLKKSLRVPALRPVNRENIKVYNWGDIHNLDAGVAFELVYGFKPNVDFTSNDEVIQKANARCWWERSSPQTQCSNAIGNFQIGTTVCYICGFPLEESGNNNTPECEHILPVFKAALYLHLYNAEYKNIVQNYKFGKRLTNDTDAMIAKEIDMEYAWAHKCCNQVKSDSDFITFNENKKRFELDFLVTKEMLIKIATDSISGKNGKCLEQSLKNKFMNLTQGKEKQKKIISDWALERIDILNEEANSTGKSGKVRCIIDYLNNNYTKSDNYSMFTLIHLCNLISSADMNGIYTTWNKMSGTPIKQAPPVEQITKATIITELTAEATKMSNFSWGSIFGTRDGRLKVKNWYKKAFNIPDGIDIDIRKDGDNQGVSQAILGSIIYINKINPEINDFFRNFYATITYPYINPNNGNINPNSVLFPGEEGRVQASIMVGQSYKILFLGIMINNMNNMNIMNNTNIFSKTENVIFNQFVERFVSKYNEEIEKLISKGNEKMYLFLMLFVFFVEKIDRNLIQLLIEKLIEQDPTSQLFDNGTYNKSNRIYPVFMKYTSNIENSVVQFYLDSSQYLKFYPEWNPEIKDVDQYGTTDTLMTENAKGIAIGVAGLIELQKNDVKILDEDMKVVDSYYTFQNELFQTLPVTEKNEWANDKNYYIQKINELPKNFTPIINITIVTYLSDKYNNGDYNNSTNDYVNEIKKLVELKNYYQGIQPTYEDIMTILVKLNNSDLSEIISFIYLKKSYLDQIISLIKRFSYSTNIIITFLDNDIIDSNYAPGVENIKKVINNYKSGIQPTYDDIMTILVNLNNSDLSEIVLAINQTNEGLEGLESLRTTPNSLSSGFGGKRKSVKSIRTRKTKTKTQKHKQHK